MHMKKRKLRSEIVIFRHLIDLNNTTARPMTVGFAEIRQHRQKQHTKRAGEAGVSARAAGSGQRRNSLIVSVYRPVRLA